MQSEKIRHSKIYGPAMTTPLDLLEGAQPSQTFWRVALPALRTARYVAILRFGLTDHDHSGRTFETTNFSFGLADLFSSLTVFLANDAAALFTGDTTLVNDGWAAQ